MGYKMWKWEWNVILGDLPQYFKFVRWTLTSSLKLAISYYILVFLIFDSVWNCKEKLDAI